MSPLRDLQYDTDEDDDDDDFLSPLHDPQNEDDFLSPLPDPQYEDDFLSPLHDPQYDTDEDDYDDDDFLSPLREPLNDTDDDTLIALQVQMNRCSKPSAVYSTIDYSNLHETACAAYRCASC